MSLVHLLWFFNLCELCYKTLLQKYENLDSCRKVGKFAIEKKKKFLAVESW